MSCEYPPRSTLGADIDNNNILSACRHNNSIDSDYNVNLKDYIIEVDSSNKLVTITLLPPEKSKHRIIHISKIDSSINHVRIVGDIEGDSYFDIEEQWENIPLFSNGTFYKVL